MQAQAVTPGFGIEVPQKAQEGEFFVFYAADNITLDVKANNPLWIMGGLLRPKMKSLTYRNGYIRKCEITQLRPHMVSEAISNIHPSERKHLKPNYVIREGNHTTTVGLRKDGAHDGLLRTEWHPASEVGVFTSKVDGLVRMPVANAAEAIQAQYFLFPDWDSITAGAAQLSRRMTDLIEHFQGRMRDASSAFETKVAQAALRSCEDYQAWGRRVTADANAMYERMKTKGEAWPIGADAAQAFDQLGIQRSDNLIQDQGNQLAMLTNVMSKMADLQIQQHVPQAPVVDPQYIEFLEWKKAQQKAEEEAREKALAPKEARVPLFAFGQMVTFEDRAARVINPQVSIFGRPGVEVEFLDDATTKKVDETKVQAIPVEE